MVQAQQTAVPPEIQAIKAKLKAGEELTEQEEERMEQYEKSLEKQVEQLTNQGAAAKGQAVGGQRGSAGLPTGSGLCPAAGAPLPTAAPTDAEMTKLLQTLASTRGAKIDLSTRKSIDDALASYASSASAGAAVFHIGGAVDEAVYTAAKSTFRDPAVLIALNNLSVILSEAGDHRGASQVARYVAKKRTDSPLAAVNLAWACGRTAVATAPRPPPC